MNSNLAKKLRKWSGGNEAVYDQPGIQPQYHTANGLTIKVSKGTPRTMNRDCSRAIYKKLKKICLINNKMRDS